MSHKSQKDNGLAAALTPAPFTPLARRIAGAEPSMEAGDGWVGPASSNRFVPGDLFAGRFRIITWLGRSESGEVWHAEDLVLQTPVAVKIIPSATAENRERILSEVRLARQITHPAVRRVFDVGEGDGTVFCSMELVEGENLAVLLKRAGRFPPERVIEIGMELCEALATAHAAGVVHGDVRPETVLVDQPGFVKLTDFGIAAGLGQSDTGSTLQKSPYRAPERNTVSAGFTEEADIYALGAVLYELLVGRPPDVDRVLRPSLMYGDVPKHLERAILDALHRNPDRRPGSAAAMRAQLGGTRAPSSSPRAMWIAGSVLAAVVAVLAVALAKLPYFGDRGSILSDQDQILIADVLNTTGDPVFDGALKVALAVALEQSPFVKVLPDERTRDALRLMQRAPTDRVTGPVAREIARREQAKAVVFASIGSLGTNYVLSIDAVESETGDVMAREQMEIANKEEVLTVLGDAATRLRTRLGDALAKVERFDAPLARATTPSLEALHAYSRALDEGRINPRPEAIPYLTHAIELDSNFAMAHALLSAVYRNMGRFVDAPAHARRAFELRDRVSERERFFISWRYYIDAVQAWDEALRLATSWTTTYPREAFAFNSLGLASTAFGDHDRAVGAFREAIRLDPRFVPPYGNLAGSLIALNRFDEARSTVEEAAAIGIHTTGTRRARFVLSLIDPQPGGGAVQAKDPDPVWTLTWEARAAAFGGRFAEAHSLYGRAIENAIAAHLRDLAAQWTVEDAELDALLGRCDAARLRVEDGLAVSRDNFTLERASRVLALCGDGTGVSVLSAELSQRFPESTFTAGVQIPTAAAALSLRRNDAARAVKLLERVKPYDHAPSAEFWSKYLRGEALLQSEHAKAAAQEFQSVAAHRGEAPLSPLFALAHLGLGRASAATGDRVGARAAYDRFFALWADADQDLDMVSEARREYATFKPTLPEAPAAKE